MELYITLKSKKKCIKTIKENNLIKRKRLFNIYIIAEQKVACRKA